MNTQLINKYNKFINKYKTAYTKTLVLSIIEPENFSTLLDFLVNARYYLDPKLKILFTIHIKPGLYVKNQESIKKLPETIFLPMDNEDNIWGTIHIFNYHMRGIKYLSNSNTKYDYFTFGSTNSMFFRQFRLDILDNYLINADTQIEELTKSTAPKTTEELNKYTEYFNNFINEDHWWTWYSVIKSTKYTLDYIKTNQIYLDFHQHEGTIFTSNTIQYIYKQWIESGIYENEPNKNWVAEEIFIPSILKTKFNIKLETYAFVDWPGIGNSHNKLSFINILNKHIEKNFLSYKWIPRAFDARRNHIRNQYINKI